MPDFTYENIGTSTYLVYAVPDKEELDSLSLGMLTHNKIPGLAATVFTQMDETKYIKYNVSSKVSAKQLFSGQVNKKRLLGVLNGIVNAMISAEDYMIDQASLLLDLDYIFADVSTAETVMICLPVKGLQAERVDIGLFFKNILFNTQFDQTENCDHVAKLINHLNSTPHFSLDGFRTVLDQIKASDNQASSRSTTAAKKQEQKPQPVVQHQAQVLSQEKKQEIIHQQDAAKSKPANQQQTPPAPAPSSYSVEPETQQKAPEKKMSFLYLMQHYNKENVALYKAQKGEKKPAGDDHTQKEAKKDKKKSKDKEKQGQDKEKKQGQATPPVGFAVPGQQQPVPSSVQPEIKQTAAASQQPAPHPLPSLPQMPVQPVSVSGGSANFGNTTVLSTNMKPGETIVLNAVNSTPEVKPFLIRRKNNEKILIDKPVYRIGKERSYVDYFIGDNSAISRSHANLVSRDGEFFIVDTNSTNHTFVNGEMIPSNVETRLTDGTRIMLANEEFEFKLI